MIEETIAENLKKALREYKIKYNSGKCPCCGQSVRNPFTQTWISKETGITVTTINKYFTGTSIPSIKTLILLADLLETSIHELLRGVES